MSDQLCQGCDTVKPAGKFIKRRKARTIPSKNCVECRNLWERYRMTHSQYAAMLARQDGRCAICREPPAGKLWVDHCHETGAVRGLLCKACNSVIGLAGDDPEVLKSAVAYLKASTG